MKRSKITVIDLVGNKPTMRQSQGTDITQSLFRSGSQRQKSCAPYQPYQETVRFFEPAIPFGKSGIGRRSLANIAYRLAAPLSSAVLALGLVGGCAALPSHPTFPEPRPLGQSLEGAPAPRRDVAASNRQQASPSEERRVTGELTLRKTLSLALLHNPALKGAAVEVRAREAERLQAGLLPNPEISADVEDFAGSGPFSGFENAEATVQLTQLVELGGDRASRVRRAAARGRLAGWDYEAQRLSVLTTAAQRYIDVLAAQNRVELAKQLRSVAEKLQDAASKRVAAGKVSPIEATRAEIVAARVQSDLEQDKSELEAARKRLVRVWGATTPRFDRVVGAFRDDAQVPEASVLEQYLKDNPAVARWADELAAQRADLSVAKAEAIPDISIGVGARQIEETGDQAFAATVSIPLPLFDRNQGRIAAAQRRVSETQYNRAAAKDQLHATFAAAYGRLSAAAKQLRHLEEVILPKAQSVFDAVSTGYREGKFDLLTLLDAQRSLFEARLSAVDARARFLKAKTEVEGLIGRSVDSVS